MPNFKITVIRVFTPTDVFGEKLTRPDGSIVEPCHLKEEQEWITDGWKKPDDFCGWAWEDFRKDFYMLYFGGDIPDTPVGVVYTVCSDGKRPVCFKIERID